MGGISRQTGRVNPLDKKTVCVVTGTRAEYGLLKPLLKRIYAEEALQLHLVATGMHLSAEFGSTYEEIEADGFPLQAKIETLLSSDTHAGMAKSTGLGLIGFSDYFTANRPDMLIVLGDRFEILAAALAAAMMNIPIAHISGGDTSEGAIDEFIRHAITKMAYLHFPTNAQSARRIVQMGESPDRVFNAGSLSVENIKNSKLLSKEQLADSLDFKLDRPYGLVTYHPITTGNDEAGAQIKALIAALERFPDMQFIITKANADSNGRIINGQLDKIKAENMRVYASLGSTRYLSAMKYAAIVIGNSSSGLYETPSFHLPCVDIGDRQKNRLRAENVLHCGPTQAEIVAAIQKGLSADFRQRSQGVKSPFGDGNTSAIILQEIKAFLTQKSGQTPLTKHFHLQ